MGRIKEKRYLMDGVYWSKIFLNRIQEDCKIKVDQISDKSKLTKDQLLNKDNLARLGDLSKSDTPALRDSLKDKGVSINGPSIRPGSMVQMDSQGRVTSFSGSLQRPISVPAYTKI